MSGEKVLQVKGVSPEWIAALKMAALRDSKTLTQWCIDALTIAALPPVMVGGTNPKPRKHQ